MSAKDIPIIFSAAMVRALLEGRKTQTRRIASLQNCEFGSIPAGKLSQLFWEHADWKKAWVDRGFPDEDGEHRNGYLHVPCHDNDEPGHYCDLCQDRGWSTTSHRLRPKLMSGNRLWVRETVACGACAPSAPSTWAASFWRREQGSPENRSGLWYRADDLAPRNPITGRGRWVSAIHMPRWVSRLTLEVAAVKVERINDITEADAIAEGATPIIDHGTGSAPYLHRIGFEHLWCRINGEGAWIANPFVVAITFRVIKANIDTPEARAA